MTHVLFLLLCFLAGVVAGHLLYLLALRYRQTRHYAHCPTCGQALAWYQHLPLVGLYLRACRACGQAAPWHQLVCCLTWGLFTAWFWAHAPFGSWGESWLTYALCCLCLVLFFTDLYYFALPNRYVLLFALLCGLRLGLYYRDFTWTALIFAGGAFLLFFLLSQLANFGEGDAKWLIASALLWGNELFLLILTMGFFCLVGQLVLSAVYRRWLTVVPLGTYIALATVYLLVTPAPLFSLRT